MEYTFKIRSYRPDDEEKIVELLKLVFNGWPHFDLPCSPLDHWKWKFMSNPIEMNTIVIAESRGRIIGCDHGLYNKIKIGKKVVPSRQGVDSAVHPDFRGKGIYTNMDKLKMSLIQQANTSFDYFASSNPIIIKVDLTTGAKPFPRAVSNLVRIRDVDLFVKEATIRNDSKKHFIRYAVHTAKILNKVKKLGVRPVYSNSRIFISDVDQFDERVNHLWDAVKEKFFFIAERKSGYLNWRYRDPRGGVYTVKQAVQDDEMRGYIVLRINSWEGSREGFIVDILTLQNRLDCFEALISEGLRFFDEAGVNIINYCGVASHPYVKSLMEFGFLETRTFVNIYYNKMVDGEDYSQFQAAFPGRLLFHYGDFDWI
jgi:hypothetical protein